MQQPMDPYICNVNTRSDEFFICYIHLCRIEGVLYIEADKNVPKPGLFLIV